MTDFNHARVHTARFSSTFGTHDAIDQLADALIDPIAALLNVRPDATVTERNGALFAEWGNGSAAYLVELPASHDRLAPRAAAATLIAASLASDARVIMLRTDDHDAAGTVGSVESAAVLTIRESTAFLAGLPSTLSGQKVSLHFMGKASHAAAAPERGINALEAALSTLGLLNGLRQHQRSETRIDAVLVDGGAAPNVVPESAAVQVWLRAPGTNALRLLTRKFVQCAESAATANGASVAVTMELALPNAIESPVLSRLAREAFDDAGATLGSRPPFFGSPPMIFGALSQLAPALVIGSPAAGLLVAIDVLANVSDRFRRDTDLVASARADLESRLRRLRALVEAAGDA